MIPTQIGLRMIRQKQTNLDPDSSTNFPSPHSAIIFKSWLFFLIVMDELNPPKELEFKSQPLDVI